jgi:hypothetical protein
MTITSRPEQEKQSSFKLQPNNWPDWMTAFKIKAQKTKIQGVRLWEMFSEEPAVDRKGKKN